MNSQFIRQEGGRQCLERIVGASLSSVTFVTNYVELDFNGPIVSAYTSPAIQVGATVLSTEDSGYRDALCGRIGAQVVAAYAEQDNRLQIDFSDKSSIVISLKPEDLVGVEAAMFRDPLTKEWNVW
jgi:hypothetical protein